MGQNISLYIGDNASGKTRILQERIAFEKNAGNSIVTNLLPYRLSYIPDIQKKQLLMNSNNELFDDLIVYERVNTLYSAQVKDLLELIYSKGDVLLLDEIDANLTDQDIIWVSTAIADCRKLWKRIYVNGYSAYLVRMFTDTDYESFVETTSFNLFYVDKDMKITKISEEDSCEYFDKIRG